MYLSASRKVSPIDLQPLIVALSLGAHCWQEQRLFFVPWPAGQPWSLPQPQPQSHGLYW